MGAFGKCWTVKTETERSYRSFGPSCRPSRRDLDALLPPRETRGPPLCGSSPKIIAFAMTYSGRDDRVEGIWAPFVLQRDGSGGGSRQQIPPSFSPLRGCERLGMTMGVGLLPRCEGLGMTKCGVGATVVPPGLWFLFWGLTPDLRPGLLYAAPSGLGSGGLLTDGAPNPHFSQRAREMGHPAFSCRPLRLDLDAFLAP